MQITVKEVGAVQKEKKYFILPVTYTDKGKEWVRKIYSFNFTDVYKAFKDAKPGEVYEVAVKKNDNGFWDWVSAEKVVQRAGEPTVKEASSGKVGTVRSTYETPEERAQRQQYIIRQSSINNAIEALKALGGEFTFADIIEMAKDFENHVYRQDDIVSDKPWEKDEEDADVQG